MSSTSYNATEVQPHVGGEVGLNSECGSGQREGKVINQERLVQDGGTREEGMGGILVSRGVRDILGNFLV